MKEKLIALAILFMKHIPNDKDYFLKLVLNLGKIIQEKPENVSLLSELKMALHKYFFIIIKREHGNIYSAADNLFNDAEYHLFLDQLLKDWHGAIDSGYFEDNFENRFLLELKKIPRFIVINNFLDLPAIEEIPRGKKILKLFYGLKGEKKLTLQEIGSLPDMSFTRERVRQIKERVLEVIRKEVNKFDPDFKL